MTKDYSYGVIPILKENNTYLFLLVHHGQANYWGFPKGHKEANEEDIETAKRELLEETGIKEILVFKEPIFEDRYYFDLNGVKYDKTATFFPGFLDTKPELTLQIAEVDDAKWLDYDQAMKILSFDTLRQILEQTKKWLDEANNK